MPAIAPLLTGVVGVFTEAPPTGGIALVLGPGVIVGAAFAEPAAPVGRVGSAFTGDVISAGREGADVEALG